MDRSRQISRICRLFNYFVIRVCRCIRYSCAKFKGYGVTASGSLTNFTDGSKTSSWEQNAMKWVVGANVLSGKSGNIMDSTGTATRAEVAQILMNFCENIVK